MEPIEKATSEQEPASNNENKPFKLNPVTIVIIVLVVAPFLYLLLKDSGTPAPQEQAAPAPIDWAATLETSKQASKSNPNFETYFNLGLAFYNNNLFDSAAVAYTKALNFDSVNNAIIYNNLCATYNNIGQWLPAAKAGARSLKLDPGSQLTKNNLDIALNNLPADVRKKYDYRETEKK